jgi:tetratricopeptide (TPR) repeat protein
MKIYLSIIALGCLLAASCGSTKQVAAPAMGSAKQKLSTVFFEANKARLQKEPAKAKELYAKVLEKEPDNATAYYYYAKICMADGDAKKAVDCSKKATELAPDNKYFNELYADALANNNEIKKAIIVYKNLAETDKKFAEKYLMTAAYYESKTGQLEQAIQTMNLLEKYYGISADLSYRKINVLRKLNKTNEIIEELNKLIKDDPSEIKYYLQKQDEYQNAKQYENAKVYGLEIEKKFANNAQLLPSQTMKAYEQKDTVKYLQLLQQCMDSKEIEPEEKIALLIPVMQLNTKDENLQKKLIGYGKNMTDAAPEDGKAISFYASVLNSSKEYDKAAVQYQKLIKKNPNQFDAWQQLFFIYSQQNKYDSLISITQKAMNYFPNQAIVYYMNGIAHQQKQNLPAAIKAYNKALDYTEGNNDLTLQTYGALGDLYNTQKDFKNSDSCFEKSLRIDSNDAMTLNNYAYFLSVRNTQLPYAERMSKKSLVLKKGEKTFLDTYAWILYMQKKYDEAAIIMKQALDADGENDATMYEHYGDILYQQNNKTKAKEYWQLAKQKGSKSSYIDKKIATGELYE